MKKSKIVCSFILAMTLILSATVPCFAIDSPYEALLKKGFSAEFLDSLTDEMISRTYEIVGDNDIGEIKIETAYITKNSDVIQTCGVISEEIFKLVIQTAEIIQKDTNIIGGFLVSINWQWSEGNPFFTWEDALAVNWDAAVFNSPDSFYSADLYRNSNDTDWIIFKEYTVPAEAEQGGLGYYTDLAFNKDSVGGGTLFVLSPRSKMIKGDKESSSVNVNYIHNQNPVGFSLGFELKGVSVGIETSLFTDTSSKTTNLHFSR